jgi:hypothetical protein
LAAALAHLAMKPSLAPLVWPLVGSAPGLLTTIARGVGKARTAPGVRATARRADIDYLEDELNLSADGTFERLQRILSKEFEVATDVIAPTARLDSLGIDSLAVIEVISA